MAIQQLIFCVRYLEIKKIPLSLHPQRGISSVG
jgi:hypothetical protein